MTHDVTLSYQQSILEYEQEQSGSQEEVAVLEIDHIWSCNLGKNLQLIYTAIFQR
jgi:hypothetical protein